MHEKSMKRNVKKLYAVLLALCLMLIAVPSTVLSVDAASSSSTGTVAPVVNDKTGVRYEWYDDIRAYRTKTGDYYKTYPVKEGYVFGGWFSESADTSAAIGESVTYGGAWAKFVPEETLSVKAQLNASLQGKDLKDIDLSTVNLRLCTSVDSLKYNGVGFEIAMAGRMTVDYPMDTVYNWIKLKADEANTEGVFVNPTKVFGSAAYRFATLRITDIPNMTFEFTNLDMKVTPYWITKDGSRVTGMVRSNLLVADELANYADDAGSFDENESTEIFCETNASSSASYSYYKGGSNAVYLKGTYKTAGTGNHFGITIRNGGKSRQVYYDGMGVKVYADGNIKNVIATYNTITNSNGVYVWSQSGEANVTSVTKNNSVISTMLSAANAGKSYSVIWAIEDNTLYGSVEGNVFLRIPMTVLCSDWVDGRYYQIGVAAYNSSAVTQNMSFTKEKIKFGFDAYGTADAPLLVKEKQAVTTSSMAYEAINGSYMSASNADGYMYGQSVSTGTPIAMETTLKWQQLSNSRSGAGITVKSGSETREIYFEYNGNSNSYGIRRQPNHLWGSTTGTLTNFSIKDRVYVNPFTTGECNIKVAVYDNKLSVLLNNITAYETMLSSSDMFGSSYSASNKVSIGVATWDSENGQAYFADTTFFEGQDAIDLKTANWTFYPGSINDTYVTKADIDVKTGTINKKSGAQGYFSMFTLGNASRAWEITGTMSHVAAVDGKAGYGQQGFVVDAGNGKPLYLLGQNEAFECRINGVWSNTGSNNIYRYNTGNNKYAFRKNSEICGFYFQDSQNTESINFKAAVVSDTIYVWLNGTFAWMVPLDQAEFGGAAAGSNYYLKLAFGDNANVQSFSNVKVKSGVEVDTGFVKTLTSAENMDWLAANTMQSLSTDGDVVVTNTTSDTTSHVYSNTSNQTIYASATYKKVNDAMNMFGILISDGTNVRRVSFKNQGVHVLTGTTWAGVNETYDALGKSYIYGQNGVSPIEQMLTSAKGTEHDVVWVIKNHTLYISVNGEVAAIMPLTALYSGWTSSANKSYKIGVGHWKPNDNNFAPVSDLEILYGTAADAKLHASYNTGALSRDNMMYDVITGAYIPNCASGYAHMYSNPSTIATVQADIEWQDMLNTASSAGISVKASNGNSIQVMFEGMNRYVRVFKNHTWGTPAILYNASTGENKLINSVLPVDRNGKCHVSATVENNTLYVKFNGQLAFKTALNDATYGITGYTNNSNVQIGISTWDANNGLSLFKNVKFSIGSVVEPQFAISRIDAGSPQIDYSGGTIVRTNSSTETKVYFAGSSQKWEVTGSMRQDDLTNLVLQGFIVKGRGGAKAGYPEGRERIFYGHEQGFVRVNIPNPLYPTDTNGEWLFDYHNINNEPTGQVGAAKYYIYNTAAAEYFRDTILTDSSTTNDTRRTAKKIDFRLVLVDDTIYFWIDDVLSWRIPLTITSFGNFEAGNAYELGIAIAGDNDNGTVYFENLKVKTGDAVDTTGVPKFITKTSTNIDNADNITGVVHRTSTATQWLTFVGEDAYRSTKWEVTGKMYRNSITDNVRLGFYVGNGFDTVRFFGYKKGFAMVTAEGQWVYDYTDPSKMNADNYVLSSVAEDFFTSPMKKDEITFRARIIDNTLYVYFDDVLSWKIPLTTESFGGFATDATYDFSVAIDGSDVGNAGFVIDSVKSGSQIMTRDEFFIRDPFMLYDNGTYYLYGSRFGGSFDVLTSKDMLVWEKQPPCFVPGANFWGLKSDYWAPEVFKYTNPDNGETAYYMFATFRGNETTSTRRRGTAILKASSPLGPFYEWSVDSENNNRFGPVTIKNTRCLDGTLYIENGVPYMIFSKEYGQGVGETTFTQVGEMYYVQLSNDLKKSIGNAVKMFDAKTYKSNVPTLDAYCTDGPQMYKAADGTLIMLWSTFVQAPGEEGTRNASLYEQIQMRSSNGKISGTWTYDNTHSVLYGITDDKFDGGHGMIFNDGSDKMILHTPNHYTGIAWAPRHKVFNMRFNTSTKWLEIVPDIQRTSQSNMDINDDTGVITPATGKYSKFILEGTSNKWELSGKFVRTDDMTTDAWCPGFVVKVGSTELTVSAVTSGIVFNETQSSRNASHAFGVTTYNKNTDVSKFVKTPRTENVMNFKAIIANDTLYVWFGYDGEEMKLSWVVPLASALYDTNGTTKFFNGFAAGSQYSLGMHVHATSGQGAIKDLTVKKGNEVNTSLTTKTSRFEIAEFNRAEIDTVNGVIESTPCRGPLELTFKGENTKWEVTGTIRRKDSILSDPWNPGFTIKAGGQTLRFDATNQGIVFEETDSYTRYPYHAFVKSQYNINNKEVAELVGSPRKESNMNFKAVIINDTFYLWLGSEGEELKLAWIIPLAETIYRTDYKTELFTGFSSGSSYSFGLFVPQSAGQGCFDNLVVKTGNAVNSVVIPTSQLTGVQNAIVNPETEAVTNIPSTGKDTMAYFPGVSNKWEITGTMTRLTNITSAGWNPGFNIKVGTQELTLTAVNQGIVFNQYNTQRYPYHAFAKTNYNLNTAISKFIGTTGEKTVMNFRALIVDDMFYVWFGYEGEEMKLSWVVPLSEAIYGAAYNDFNANGIDDSQDVIYEGFTAGSQYSMGINIMQTSAQGDIHNLTIKTGDAVDTSGVPEYVISDSKNIVVDEANGIISNVPNAGDVLVEFQGTSEQWEISGSFKRPDDQTADQWCPGFTVKVGTQKLTLSAVTQGIIFNQFNAKRYPWHALSGVTQYNKNTDISKFIGKPRSEDVMNFKAMIVNDTLYVWFGFEGENMKLSWIVPLAEALYGVSGDKNGNGTDDAQEVIYDGFASGSKYNLAINAMNTAGQGQITNLSIKTGDEVDTTAVPKFITSNISNAVVDEQKGTITSMPGKIANVDFTGNYDAWEITGTVVRTDATSSEPWCPGFNIRSGDKVITLSAVNQGFVFNQFAADRYAYHALGATQYNRNTKVNKFVGSPRQEDEMQFKAVLMYGAFFVWFGYEGEEMELTWVLPLENTLYQTDGTTPIFDGFEMFGTYNLGLHVMATAGEGYYKDINVKTGYDVDDSFYYELPEDILAIIQ